MTTEAIIFFADNHVIKEMLYPEFEAVLDRVVGISEFAGQKVGAVYLRINGQLQANAAVFFNLGFDAKGNADDRWNIPLQHLADKGGRGPDLGAGAIKLSCRSQCADRHLALLQRPLEHRTCPEHFGKIVGRQRLNI